MRDPAGAELDRPTIILSTSGLVAFRVRDDEALTPQPNITGSGSVTFEQLGSLSSRSTISLGEAGEAAGIRTSTCSGGATFSPDCRRREPDL